MSGRAVRLRLARPDLASAVLLLLVYGVTLARGVTYWDAGEFLAAIHSLGIPHPPGTPLYVLLARVWTLFAAPALGFTIAVNAFSALCTAAAFGIVANIFWRATDDGVAAFAAALTAGLMSTVWLNATETEVYACALLASFVILWCARRYALSLEHRWLVLTLYTCGLSWSLHLTALLTVPAACYAMASAIEKPRLRDVITGLLLAVLGATAILFMLLRARHDPAINQGNPSTLSALIDVVQRHQYDVAPLWPRRAPLWLQFGNVFEYADWQVALGLAPDPAPTFARTTFTIAFALLAVFGSLRHRAINRASWRTWLILLLTTSVGVVLYLNLRAGASFGAGVLPPGALHEARDRDYFFTWAFVCWGAWAGFGAVQLGRTAAARLASYGRSAQGVLAMSVIVAALPLALNWSVVRHERRDEQQRVERTSVAMLDALPSRAVFIANGDNDTYPLWYLQQVRAMRRDVTVVTAPLLTPEWNREELRRRYGLLDSVHVANWYGTRQTLEDIRVHAARAGRPVVVSAFNQGRDSTF
jgi:transmembrane protein TMEM260 (protein O-mannosyltransferase)